MADLVFNVSLGRIVQRAAVAASASGGAVLRVFLLKATEADGTVRDYDDMSALLGAAGNTEADFTNYTNKSVDYTNITITVDDTNDRVDVDIPDQTWSSAGGTTDNTLTDVIIAYDPDGTDTDSGTIPMTLHDFTPTTTGADLTMQVASTGFARVT